MSETSGNRTTDPDTEVVKWYTRARRFPQLIGKTPDGATIWGGPYTYTQVIVGVGVIVVGSKTTWLWGHFGLIGNALILLGGAYGLVLLLGRLPLGSRNPLSVSAGAVRAMSAPAHGDWPARRSAPAAPITAERSSSSLLHQRPTPRRRRRRLLRQQNPRIGHRPRPHPPPPSADRA